MIDTYDIFGLVGVAITLYAYVRMQFHRDYAKMLRYSVLNGAGAGLYLVSLYKHWNVASCINNVVWLLISLYGVYRCIKYMRQTPPMPPEQAAE